MTTAMTRATIAIVRVSMARPYSVSRAVSPDPPSGTPLPLTGGLGASRAGPRRLSPGRGPGVRQRAIDSLLAAASVERQQRRRRYRVPCDWALRSREHDLYAGVIEDISERKRAEAG